MSPRTGFGVTAAAPRQAGVYGFLTTNPAIVTALHIGATGAAQDPALRKVWEFLAPAGTLPPYVVLGRTSERANDAFGLGGTVGTETLLIVADTGYQARQVYGVVKAEAEGTGFPVAGHHVAQVAVEQIDLRRDPDTGRALLDADVTVTTRAAL